MANIPITIPIEPLVSIDYLVYRNINIVIDTVVSIGAVVIYRKAVTIAITTNVIASYYIASDVEEPSITILTGPAYPEGGLTVRHKMLPYNGKLYGAFEVYSSGNHYRTYFNVEADPATKSVMSGGTLIVDDLDEGTTIPKGGEISLFDSPGNGTRSGLAARETSATHKNSSNSNTYTRTTTEPTGFHNYEPDNYEMMFADDGSGSIVIFTKDSGGHDLLYASPNSGLINRFDIVSTVSNPPLRWKKDLYRISPFGDNTHVIVTHTGTNGQYVMLVKFPYTRISAGGFTSPNSWTYYPDSQFDGAKFHPTLISFLHSNGIRYVQDIYSNKVSRCTWIPNTGNFPADYHRYFLTRDDAQNTIPANWSPLAWETYQKNPTNNDYYHFLYSKRLVVDHYEVDVMYSNITSGPVTSPSGGFRTKVNVFQIDDITTTRTHWSGSLQNTARGPALLAEQKAPTGDPLDDYNLYIWIDWFEFSVRIIIPNDVSVEGYTTYNPSYPVNVEILTDVYLEYITENPDAPFILIKSELSPDYIIGHVYELYRERAHVVAKVGPAYPEGGLYANSNMLTTVHGGDPTRYKLYGAFESYVPGSHYRTYYDVTIDPLTKSLMYGGTLITDDLDENPNYRKGGDYSLLAGSIYANRHGIASRLTTTSHRISLDSDLDIYDATTPIGYEPENYLFFTGDGDAQVFYSHFNSPNYELYHFSYQLGETGPWRVGTAVFPTFTEPFISDYFRIISINDTIDYVFIYGNDEKIDTKLLNINMYHEARDRETINWSNNNLPDYRWSGTRGYTTLVTRYTNGDYGYTQSIIGNSLLRTRHNKSTEVVNHSVYTNFVGNRLDNLGGAGDWNTLAWQAYQKNGNEGDYYHFIFRKKFIDDYYQIDVAYTNIFNDTLGDYYYIDNLVRVYDINPTRTHWAGCLQGLSPGPMLLAEQKSPTGDPADDYNIYIWVDFFVTLVKKIIKIQIESEVNISFKILKPTSINIVVESDLAVVYKIEKPFSVSIPIQTNVDVTVVIPIQRPYPVLISIVSTVSINYVIEKKYSISIPTQIDVTTEYIIEHHYPISILIEHDVSIEYQQIHIYPILVNIDSNVLITYVNEIQKNINVYLYNWVFVQSEIYWAQYIELYLTINLYSNVSILYDIAGIIEVDVNINIDVNVEVNVKIPVTTLKHHINHHCFGVKWHEDVIDIINEKRAYFGLSEISKPTALIYHQFQDIAQHHSQDMADTGVFEHDSPLFPVGWQTFQERIDRIGVNGAENQQARHPNITYELWLEGVTEAIIVNNDTFPTPLQVVESWWNSVIHRDIILNDWGSEYPVYSYMGMTTTPNALAGLGSGIKIVLTNVFINLERIMSNINLNINYEFEGAEIKLFNLTYDFLAYTDSVTQHYTTWSFLVEKQHEIFYGSNISKQHHAKYYNIVNNQFHINFIYTEKIVAQQYIKYDIKNTGTVVKQHETKYSFGIVKQHNALYHSTIFVTAQHNANYHSMDAVVVQHNALYHSMDTVVVQHNANYHSMDAVVVQHNANYHSMDAVVVQHNANYRLLGITHKQHQALYSIRLTPVKQHYVFYTYTSTIAKQHESVYDLSLFNKIVKSHRVLYSLMPKSLIIAKPFVQMTNGESITELVLSASDSDYFWNATIRLADIADYNNLIQDQDIEITIGGDTYQLMIISKTKERTGTVGLDLQITASSPTIRLDLPRATPEDFIFESSTTIKDAVETILGQATNWNLIDWMVTPYKIMYKESVPIKAAQTIVESVGGTLYTEKDGTITVAPIEKVNTHQYFLATPEHIFVDENDIIKISEGHIRKEGYNKYRIREGSSVFGDRADWIVDEVHGNKGIIKVYPSPWRENVIAFITQAPLTTTITRIGVVERQEGRNNDDEVDWEIIEFVDGTASTSYPIKTIDEKKWLSTELSDLVIGDVDESTVLEVSRTINDGYGLLAIKYTTRSINFEVEGVYDQHVQVLIKEA